MKQPAVTQIDRQTRMAAVVFADIVGFSKKSVPAQLAAKEVLTRLLQRLVTPYPASSRIVLDTGDGAAVGFLVSPEYALSLTLRLRRELDAAPEDSLLRSRDLRLGINLGPLKVVNDVNGHPNMVGEGVNSAERIMSFAEPGETTASRSFQEAVFYLDSAFQTLFEPLGLRSDKHGREHEVFRLTASTEAIDAALQSLGMAGRAPTVVATSKPTLGAMTAMGRPARAGLIAAVVIVGVGVAAWVAWPSRQGARELPAATSAAPREPAAPSTPPVAAPSGPSAASVAPSAPAPAPAPAAPTEPSPVTATPASATSAGPPSAASSPPPSASGPTEASPTPAKPPADASTTKKPKSPPPKSAMAGAPTAPQPSAAPTPTPQSSPRCSRLLQRAALGEALTPDEQREMTTSCR